MPDSEITIGELSRTIAAMEARIAGAFAEVHRRFDNLQFVNKETYAVQEAAQDSRIEALEEKDRYRGRAILVSLLYPGLLAILMALAFGR